MTNEELVQRVETLERELDRAKAWIDIENLMGRYEYLHSGNLHFETIDECFASEMPDVSIEIAGSGKFVGRDEITKWFANQYEISPQLPNGAPEVTMVGVYGEHTLTTTLIEVAEDGQTAQGIWISPGHTAANKHANWLWGRYFVDFIKINGKWKIWHFLHTVTFWCPFETPWTDDSVLPIDRRIAKDGQYQIADEYRSKIGPTYCEGFANDRVMRYWPQAPWPYKTFSETRSMVEPPEGYVFQG